MCLPTFANLQALVPQHQRTMISAPQAKCLALCAWHVPLTKRQTELLASLSQQATVIIIIIIIMEQQYEPFKQYLSYRKMARHVCISWSWARASLPTFIKHNKP